MKKIIVLAFIVSSILVGSSITTAGMPLKNVKKQISYSSASAVMGNGTPPEWATGNFSGVWGITVFGVPLSPLGWITGYYQNIGLGKLEANYASYNQTNATATLGGFMLWIFFLGGVRNITTGNTTWVSGIGIANKTSYYLRLNAIIGPSYYMKVQYAKFENTTKAF